MIQIEISLGEALDRLSILWVKTQNVKDKKKHIRVTVQYQKVWSKVYLVMPATTERAFLIGKYEELKRINGELWELENVVRNPDTIPESRRAETLAASYHQVSAKNDVRARLKREIDEEVGDVSGEVKEHEK